MIKKILIILGLCIGCMACAFDETLPITNINSLTGGDRIQYLQNIKTLVFAKDCVYKLDTPEFKKIIKEHKKDNNYPENYYAAQTGYTSFRNNNLSAMFTPKMDVMYMYAVQAQNNLRITYYYTVLGHLKYIDFMYGNYPSYPYFARKYTTRGKLYETLYCPDEMTQIKFNNKGTKAEIWYKGVLTEKINEI